MRTVLWCGVVCSGEIESSFISLVLCVVALGRLGVAVVDRQVDVWAKFLWLDYADGEWVLAGLRHREPIPL